jgi:hypothetical protein
MAPSYTNERNQKGNFSLLSAIIDRALPSHGARPAGGGRGLRPLPAVVTIHCACFALAVVGIVVTLRIAFDG